MTKNMQVGPIGHLCGLLCVGIWFVVLVYSTSNMAEAQNIDSGSKKTAPVALARAWSPETIPGRSNSVVYLEIHNNSGAVIQLTGVSSDIAGSAKLHESVLVDGMMKMQSVPLLSVSPGETAFLKPGGLHVMLMGLKKSLAVGDSHRLELHFSKGQSLVVEVAVFPISKLSFEQ